MNKGYGSTLVGLAWVVIIALKVTDVIDWSWWWILVPLWLPLAFSGIIIGVGLIMLVLGLIGLIIGTISFFAQAVKEKLGGS